MALHKSDLMMKELSEYLDDLPATPCEDPPASRYFCTVCERLNKSVQSRCSIYKSRAEGVGLVRGGVIDEPDEDEEEGKVKKEGDKVEFKVVADDNAEGQQRPMFEIVKPPVDESEPLEMSLLEKEAIEFELTGDGDISEDALEVEPMEVEEFDEDLDGLEVEPLEVEEIDVVPAPAFEELPADEPAPVSVPKPVVKKKKAVKKRKPKVAAATAAGGPPAQLSPTPRPAAAHTPSPAPAATVTPKPVAEAKPIPQDEIPDDLLKDIEEQLIKTSNCTICGAGLTNTKFCTQCGSKVVITTEGVYTESRDAAPAAPKRKKAVKRKVVKK